MNIELRQHQPEALWKYLSANAKETGIVFEGFEYMQRTLIIIGLIVIALGLLWPWIDKLGFGRLPGDIVIERENFRFYFPITSMIVVSVVVSIVLWLLRR